MLQHAVSANNVLTDYSGTITVESLSKYTHPKKKEKIRKRKEKKKGETVGQYGNGHVDMKNFHLPRSRPRVSGGDWTPNDDMDLESFQGERTEKKKKKRWKMRVPYLKLFLL